MQIPIEVTGAILNSPRPGHKVRVSDDSDSTGGLFVYEWWDGSNGPNQSGSFDSWVASPEDLLQFFSEAGWQVGWSA